MASSRAKKTDSNRKFIEISGWESFQYSGSHRKAIPPWKWFRVHNSFIASPIWFEMTKPQRADFVTLLSLASRTGNMIPKDKRWLSSHGVSAKTLPSLEQLSLIREFSLRSDDQRIKQLRLILSGGTPTRGEERREEENRKEESRDAGSLSDGSAKKQACRTPPHDFKVSPEMRQWAEQKRPDVDIDQETEGFMVYEFGRSITDWCAAWKKWILGAKAARKSSPGGSSSSIHELAKAHGLTQRADEPEENFRKRVTDAMIMSQYCYDPDQFRQ